MFEFFFLKPNVYYTLDQLINPFPSVVDASHCAFAFVRTCFVKCKYGRISGMILDLMIKMDFNNIFISCIGTFFSP